MHPCIKQHFHGEQIVNAKIVMNCQGVLENVTGNFIFQEQDLLDGCYRSYGSVRGFWSNSRLGALKPGGLEQKTRGEVEPSQCKHLWKEGRIKSSFHETQEMKEMIRADSLDGTPPGS